MIVGMQGGHQLTELKNEYYEVTMKRILENKDKEQIYYKGRGRDEVCHREYNKNGAQQLPKEIRNMVITDYDSVDADSCYSACLIVICRAVNIKPHKILIEAVVKNKLIRKHVAAVQGISIDAAKEMITKCLYGAEIENCKSAWLDTYSREIRKLIPKLVSPADVQSTRKRNAQKKIREGPKLWCDF